MSQWILLRGCASLVAAHLGAVDADPAMRGLKPVTIRDERGGTVSFAEHHALVIGNAAYTGGWNPLPGVAEDVTAIQTCLERHGFAVQVALNLTKQALTDVIDTFIEEKAQREDARVVLYYAGHGHTEGRVGYLVGVDAPKPSERGFQRKAYEIGAIKIKALQAKSRHVLFAFDACFAGSVFTPMRSANDYVLSAAREPVRMFLTSGSADEQVPDQSFFRLEFIAGVNGAADANRDGYVTGSELGTYIRQTVRDRAAAAGMRLSPQAGVSEQEGFNRGDLVFIPPGPATTAGPGTPAFDLSDLATQPAVDWAAWQARQDEAIRAVQALRDRPVATQREAWRRFLSAFPEDNPTGTRDDEHRATAAAALRSLASQGVAEPGAPPAQSPVAPLPASAAALATLTVDGTDYVQAPLMADATPAGLFAALCGNYELRPTQKQSDGIGFMASTTDGPQMVPFQACSAVITDEKRAILGPVKLRRIRIDVALSRARLIQHLHLAVATLTDQQGALLCTGADDAQRGQALTVRAERYVPRTARPGNPRQVVRLRWADQDVLLVDAGR